MDHNPYAESDPRYAKLVHGEYRGGDDQSFQEQKIRQSKPALIIFEDRPVNKRPVIIDSLPSPSDLEGKKKVSVRVSHLTSTQFTGIRLHIPRPGSLKEVQYRIFGDAITTEEKNRMTAVGHQTVTFGQNEEENVDVIDKTLKGH